jgi:hypothetical protein
MSQITALVADTSSVGYTMSTITNNAAVYSSQKKRRNPQNAVARLRTVMNPHIVQEVPGGMVSADFTVPAEDAQRWRPMLRYGAYCWLFDGQTPVFFGQLEQPTWTDTGDVQLNVSGPWVALGRSRMYELWDYRDMGAMPQGIGANASRNASATVKSGGTLELSFNRGETLASGDHISVEYLLPHRSTSGGDTQRITGFEVHISDATFNGNANIIFRVQSISAPGSAGVNLWSSTATGSSGRVTMNDVFSENTPAGAWGGGAAGALGLRFGLFATGATTAGGGIRVGLDRVRVTTREAVMATAASSQDTATIARDLLSPRGRDTSSSGYAPFDLPEPFWPSDHSYTGSTGAIKYGLDAVTGTGTAPNSGIGLTGFSIMDWTSPTEILLALATIDGSHVGFYLPYNQRGGYDAGNINDDATRSLWLSARPQLYYQAWPDPKTNPDYTIHIREGAKVEPDTGQRQGMINVGYSLFSTQKGQPDGAFYVDGDPISDVLALSTQGLNYLSSQGFRVAEDWTVDSSVDIVAANSLAANLLEVRRNPFASSTVTITNDGNSRFPILKAGAQVPHLSMIRPGSVRLVDVPGASGLRAGYATRVEWWGATLDEPEHVEITLGDPGQMIFERRLGWAGLKANRQRVTTG